MSEPADLDQRDLLLAAALADQEHQQQQQKPTDGRAGEQRLLAALHLVLHPTLKGTELRLEVITRHSLRCWCFGHQFNSFSVFLIRDIATTVMMPQNTTTIRYGDHDHEPRARRGSLSWIRRSKPIARKNSP